MRRISVVGLLLLGVVLAACGAGQDQAMPVVTGARAQKLVAASAGKAEAAKTAKLSGSVTVDVAGRHATIPLDGAIDFRTNAVEFGMDFGSLAAADGLTMQIRVVDGVAYMGLDSLPAAARDAFEQRMQGKHWIRLDPRSLGVDPGAGSSAFGGDAGASIGSLRGIDDVTRVGVEDVGGVSTTHYRGSIDVAKAVTKLPPRMQDQMRRMPGFTSASWNVDAWVDAGGLLRKMAIDIDGSTVKATEVFELHDFGAPVDLTAPPADDVVDFGTVFPGMLGGSRLPTT